MRFNNGSHVERQRDKPSSDRESESAENDLLPPEVGLRDRIAHFTW